MPGTTPTKFEIKIAAIARCSLFGVCSFAVASTFECKIETHVRRNSGRSRIIFILRFTQIRHEEMCLSICVCVEYWQKPGQIGFRAIVWMEKRFSAVPITSSPLNSHSAISARIRHVECHRSVALHRYRHRYMAASVSIDSHAKRKFSIHFASQ